MDKMKKISEAKKSELVKKEEYLAKEFKRLEEVKSDIFKDTKEFNSIMDKQLKKLKKEQSAFDIKSTQVRTEQKKEQERLDSRSRIQLKEKEAMLSLRVTYENGIGNNKEESKRHSEIVTELASDKATIIAEGYELTRKIEEVKQLKDKLKADKEKIDTQLNETIADNLEVEQAKKSVQEKMDGLQSFEQDLIKKKAEYINKNLEIGGKERELKEVERKLKDKESYFVKVMASLDERKAKAERLEENLRVKEINLKGTSDNVDKKYKDYFKLKKETDILIEKSRASNVSVTKKESQLIKDKELIDKDKLANSSQSKTLSDWSKELKKLEQDLKDWQKALGIDEKELKRKQKLLDKIRSAKKED